MGEDRLLWKNREREGAKMPLAGDARVSSVGELSGGQGRPRLLKNRRR